MIRVNVRRARASVQAYALSFLLTAVIVFLLALSVKNGRTAAPAAAKMTETELTLEGGTCYCVHMGVFEDELSARVNAARYVRRGAAGYVFSEDGWLYAIGNLYDRLENAQKAADNLKNMGISAGIAAVSANDAALKIRASEADAVFLDQMWRAVVACERELLSISERLDAGEVTEKEARVLLSVLQYDLSRPQKLPHNEKALEENEILKKLLLLYENARNEAGAIQQNAEGELYLSARVKYACAAIRLERLKALREIDGNVDVVHTAFMRDIPAER